MSKRAELIKSIEENGKTQTWEDYAIEYDARDGKQANDWWRWFDSVGRDKGEWEPGLSMTDGEFSETVSKSVNPEKYLTPSKDFTETKEWQEFLNWRKSQEKNRDFIQGTYVVMGCVHVPFHNRPFFEAGLQLINDIQPEGLVLAGDIMDMNSLSSHDRGRVALPGVTLGWEYDEGNKALDALDAASDWKVKHYLWGNHEDRYHRYMSKVDNAKLGNALQSPTDALNLHKRGYVVQENWKEATAYLGKHLEIIHGTFCNIHTAKKHIDAFRTSIMFFHTHRFQTYLEGNVGGFNMGWMGDADSQAFGYADKGQKSRWNNAFAIVHIDDQGGYHVEPILWQNDRFYYGSKVYK